jgi:hypothetical protein
MATPDRDEFTRLILQIERDLLSQAHLRTLLTEAGATVADHRRELRTIEARLKRPRPVNGMRARR